MSAKAAVLADPAATRHARASLRLLTVLRGKVQWHAAELAAGVHVRALLHEERGNVGKAEVGGEVKGGELVHVPAPPPPPQSQRQHQRQGRQPRHTVIVSQL
jgi:hypothetical protein